MHSIDPLKSLDIRGQNFWIALCYFKQYYGIHLFAQRW